MCDYADDVVIVPQRLVQVGYRMGHNLNISKTKTIEMLVRASERRRNLQNLFIADNSFDAFNKFRYLGNMVDNEGCINTTIHDRIQTGNRAQYANSRLLRHNTKIKIQKTLIRLSGCYFWRKDIDMKKQEQETLRRFERNTVKPVFYIIQPC